jgi:hypothetical protein
MLTPLRNAVLHSAWGRGKIDLPPGIAKKLYETPVVTSAAPFAPPFRKDLAKALRVESVPEKAKELKLKIKDERQGARGLDQTVGQTSSPDIDQARKQKIDALAAEAAQGNRDARRQMHQLEQQQKQAQAEQRKAERKAAQQPQGERVGQPAKPQAQREMQRPQPQAVPKAQPRTAPVQRPEFRPQPSQQQQVTHQPRQVEAPRQSQKPEKIERKQGPPTQPAAAAPSQGHGKGKGRKP